jgi:hypothetical protein
VRRLERGVIVSVFVEMKRRRKVWEFWVKAMA